MAISLRRHASYLFLIVLLGAFIAFGWLLRGWILASCATSLRHELSSLMNQVDRLSGELELELAFMEECLTPEPGEFLERDGKAFGKRWDEFNRQARFSGLLKAAYFFQVRPDALYRFRPEAGAFLPAGPDDKLQSVIWRFEAGERRMEGNPSQDVRELLARASDGESYRVFSVSALEAPPGQRQLPPPGQAFYATRRLERNLGFMVLALDDATLASGILPELGERYFGKSSGYREFALRASKAVDPATVVALGSAKPREGFDWSNPDFSRPIFFQPTRMNVVGIYATARGYERPGQAEAGRVGEIRIMRRDVAPAPDIGQDPIDAFRFTYSGAQGGWIIEATHRAGSLDRAIAERAGLETFLAFVFLAGVYALIAGLVFSSRRSRLMADRERDFIASVSHELKTPIAVVLTAAGNMEKGIVGQERVGAYGAMLAKEGRRLRDSVEGILMVSGLQSAQRGAKSETFPLADLAREAAGKLEDLAASRSARISVLEEQKPIVKASRAMLCSALTSLVSNALRYGPEGGEVLLRVRAYGGPGRRKAELSVEDRGPGIGYAERRRVFDPFWRGSAAQDSGLAGTGLGLYLARRIARMHSGDVSYRPRQGGGSCFALSLPEEIEA